MAIKRAGTRAVLKLPAVADIFAEEPEAESETQDAARDAVLVKLRGWFRMRTDLDSAARDMVVSLVFRVVNLKAISFLATDMLEEGISTLETVDLDWASPTLKDDYRAHMEGNARVNIVDLFGDDPVQGEVDIPEASEPEAPTAQKQTAEEKRHAAAGRVALKEFSGVNGLSVARVADAIVGILPQDFDVDHMSAHRLGVYKAAVSRAVSQVLDAIRIEAEETVEQVQDEAEAALTTTATTL